ncbi:MAG: protein translocase subunit SecF [Oscillospiraceae bacterium]|nr:protein translocase subunit SecF [Oscillospiraceae bacterium]
MHKKFNIDFIGHRKIFFIISALIVAFSILSTFIFGVELDIQFKGGTIITYVYEGDLNADDFVADAKELLGGMGVNYTTGVDFSTGKNNIQLSLVSNEGISSDMQFELTTALTEKYAENNVELIESSDVSPSSGKEFFLKCIVAVILSAIVLIIYIAIRFKKIGGWLAGICAILALIHDCVIVYGTFVVCGMNINANFMAVILTILGYSINDTIVVYDRVRENMKLYGRSKTRDELVNMSINQCLTRSINTSITTVFAMLAVTVVAAIFGVTSIISFSLPVMIGMIIGTYSSVCFTTPLWAFLESKNDGRKGSKGNNKGKTAPSKA